MNVKERLSYLRKLMRERRLDAYIVPSSDPHQSEYTPERWKRRQFMSGFDGSAGTLVVCSGYAGLWTDSRYFLQAEKQLAGTGIELQRLGEPGVAEPEDWLARELQAGARVGFDPQVVSFGYWQKLKERLETAGMKCLETLPDLCETVWGRDLPPYPAAPVRPHPLKFAGESTRNKLARLRERLSLIQARATVVCALDEIAWLLNLRGGDIENNPFLLSYLVVEKNRARLFADEKKFPPPALKSLAGLVEVLPYRDINLGLSSLGKSRVLLDPATSSRWVASRLQQVGAEMVLAPSAVAAWKACKNPVEIDGMRRAQLRESLNVVRLFAWLEKETKRRRVSEIEVVEKMEELRRRYPEYVGPSFDTIAGWGPNGAVVHYHVDKKDCARFRRRGLLLLDTGGQYLDGTSDLTRTVTLGKPVRAERRAYTAVLQGQLALTRSLFRAGADGYQLDVIARHRLWQAGMHYGHGTGHGLGAALSVHEGPFSVSARKVLVPLEPGNVLSIEPGVYLAGRFGVRLENIAAVVERKQNEFGIFFGFETLTFCPYDRRLIDTALLSPDERRQIDAYHRQVLRKLLPRLSAKEASWLRRACRPLKR